MKGVLLLSLQVLVFFPLLFSSSLAWNDYRGVGEEWGSPRWSFRSGLSGRMSPIGRYPSGIRRPRPFGPAQFQTPRITPRLSGRGFSSRMPYPTDNDYYRPRPAPIDYLPSGGLRPTPFGPVQFQTPGRITPRRGFSSRMPYPTDSDYYRPPPPPLDFLRPPGIRPTPFGPLSGRSAMYDSEDSDSDESDSDESGEDDESSPDLQGRFFGGFLGAWACNINNFNRAVWGLKPNCGSSISPPRSPPPPPRRPPPPPPPRPRPPPPPPPISVGSGIDILPPMGPTTYGRSMFYPMTRSGWRGGRFTL